MDINAMGGIKMKDKNFLECKSVDEANEVNLDEYRFERYSDTKDVYIFVKRRHSKSE